MDQAESPSSTIAHPSWCSPRFCTIRDGLGGQHCSYPAAWRLDADDFEISVFRVAGQGQPETERIYTVRLRPLEYAGGITEIHMSTKDLTKTCSVFQQLAAVY